MSKYIIPVILIFPFLVSAVKRKNAYEDFVSGVQAALKTVFSIFPYVTAVFIMTELFEKSGLNGALIDLSGHFFKIFGIDEALIPLILIKPFSGSASLSVLSEITKNYGVDSYISRCAATIYGSSETIFYVSAVYFSECKSKPPMLAIIISLVANFVSIVFACFIVRIL